MQRFVFLCRWSAKSVRCSVAPVRSHETPLEARSVTITRHTCVSNIESGMTTDCKSDISNTLNTKCVTFIDSVLITGAILQYGLTA